MDAEKASDRGNELQVSKLMGLSSTLIINRGSFLDVRNLARNPKLTIGLVKRILNLTRFSDGDMEMIMDALSFNTTVIMMFESGDLDETGEIDEASLFVSAQVEGVTSN